MSKAEQGVTKDRYQIIPRTLIFITRPGEVLLLKGAPNKRIWANLYNGVGGHVESGEDELSAARRELKEETNLERAPLHTVGIISVDTGENPGIILFVFKGEALDEMVKTSSEGVLEWINVESLQDYALVEDLHELIPRVLRSQPGDPLFYGYYFYEGDHLRMIFN